MRVPKVKFLIAGMQKSGTTALQKYLCQHPDLCLSQQKELHYFDNETSVNWAMPNYADYEAHFGHKTSHQICGEATPIYTFWPNSLDRIYAYNPNMKLIILLRERCDRAYSHWIMERTRETDTLPFAQAIREGRERFETQNCNAPQNRVISYVERGFYAPQLSRAKLLFGEDNLLIIKNTSLLANPKTVLDAICKFLGVAEFASSVDPIFIRPVEPQRGIDSMSEADRIYLNELYSADVKATANLRLTII